MTARLSPILLALVASACASASAGPRPLARVNGEPITGAEMRQEFGRSHRSMEKVLGQETEVRTFLKRVVDRRLFVQEGYRMGIHELPAVRAPIAQVRAQKLVETLLRDEVDVPATPTDDEVFAAYAALGELVDARQVVLPTRAQAEEARAAVVAGADLEKLARERSTAPSALRGGVVVIRWGADEAREKVLLAAKPGELTPVFETGAGWEFARIEKRRQVERPPFEKVANQLRGTVERRKALARQRGLIDALWAKYEVKLLECAPTFEALEAAAKAPGKDPVPCATWRGGALTTQDVAEALRPGQLAKMKDAYPAARAQLLEDLTNRRVAALEAEARGYGARPEVAAAVKEQEEALVESTLFSDWVVVDVTVTEPDARAYHASHPDEFVHDAQFEVAQIVLESAERAAEVEAKLKAGEPFEALARAHTLDEAARESGGHLGMLPRRALRGSVAPIAKLSPGEVSAPIEVDGTWRIVKLLKIVPERPRPFEEVAAQARAKTLQERKKAALEAWIAQLRADARIELDDRAIRAYEKERAALLREEQRVAAERKAADEARHAALVARAKALPGPPKPAAAPGAPSAPAPASE